MIIIKYPNKNIINFYYKHSPAVAHIKGIILKKNNKVISRANIMANYLISLIVFLIESFKLSGIHIKAGAEPD